MIPTAQDCYEVRVLIEQSMDIRNISILAFVIVQAAFLISWAFIHIFELHYNEKKTQSCQHMSCSEADCYLPIRHTSAIHWRMIALIQWTLGRTEWWMEVGHCNTEKSHRKHEELTRPPHWCLHICVPICRTGIRIIGIYFMGWKQRSNEITHVKHWAWCPVDASTQYRSGVFLESIWEHGWLLLEVHWLSCRRCPPIPFIRG